MFPVSHFPNCKVLDYRVHALVFALNDIGESVNAYFVNESFYSHDCLWHGMYVEFIL